MLPCKPYVLRMLPMSLRRTNSLPRVIILPPRRKMCGDQPVVISLTDALGLSVIALALLVVDWRNMIEFDWLDRPQGSQAQQQQEWKASVRLIWWIRRIRPSVLRVM
jgi:hypothetical protein